MYTLEELSDELNAGKTADELTTEFTSLLNLAIREKRSFQEKKRKDAEEIVRLMRNYIEKYCGSEYKDIVKYMDADTFIEATEEVDYGMGNAVKSLGKLKNDAGPIEEFLRENGLR